MGKQNNNTREQAPRRFSWLFTLGVGTERDYFIENLSVLLASGMNIIAALDGIKDGLRSARMKRIVEILKEDIDAGSPIWKALQNTGLLRPHIISLVKIGEEAGRLPENLKVIATQEEKERLFRSKIRSAMMYPVFVLVLTFVIGIGIAWFILPRLAGVFRELKIPLPFITKALIAIGTFLGAHGATVVPIFIVCLAAALYVVFVMPKTRALGQLLLFNMPGVGRLIRETELARFGYILGTLLGAGLPVVEAIRSLEQATSSHMYRQFYGVLSEQIESGNSFGRSFAMYLKSRTLIPTPMQQLIISGEQSGRLPDTFLKIGSLFESKTETTTKNLAIILEPILLVIVWIGVVAVALAVILPIYSLIGGLNP